MGEVNNFQCRIKLTESMEQSWNFKLVFFMSSDAVVALHQEYFVPKQIEPSTVASACLIEEILVIHRGFTGILDGFDMHGVIGNCGRLGRVQDSGNHYLLHFLHRRHAPKIYGR